MNEKYANNFFEILTALSENTELKKKVIDLIETRPIMGKALEEQLRKDNFRKIMLNLINGEISNLESSYQRVLTNIPENSSKYAGNRQVFS